jgi:AraC-like DNA-binding protein
VQAIQYLESTKPDQVSYRQLFDHLRRSVSFTEAFVVATLLRGTLQIIQPQRLNEAVQRTYDRAGQRVDVYTWQAMRTRETVVRSAESDDFSTAFMTPLAFRHVAILPLQAPLLVGYPGALHIYRSEEGPFTEEELECLAEFAGRLDELAAGTRVERMATVELTEIPENGLRLALFNADGVPLEFSQPSQFDQESRARMAHLAINRLAQATTDDIVGDRILVTDADGDSLTYRAVTYNNYPALGGGRFVGFFAQPEPTELASLRTADVVADPELSRLIPALRFMYNEFRKSPTLVDTAKTVHLSPFHFHRRFSDLLGLTPKHYMLDCQIADAKKELLAGSKDLATIAADGGFAHQSHFTSRFKQATGQTPTRWRRMALDRRRGR